LYSLGNTMPMFIFVVLHEHLAQQQCTKLFQCK
jgi:hypothetical protein